jgi:hypothetical protein
MHEKLNTCTIISNSELYMLAIKCARAEVGRLAPGEVAPEGESYGQTKRNP